MGFSLQYIQDIFVTLQCSSVQLLISLYIFWFKRHMDEKVEKKCLDV
jgi:hypothetical protein